MNILVKLISNTSGNISRACLIQHYAKKKSEILNLTGKLTLQNNIALFVGNVLGFLFSYNLPTGIEYSFILVSVFSALNLYAVKKSLKSIILVEFNFKRMAIFCEELVLNNKIPSPKEVHNKYKSVSARKYNNIHFCTHTLEFIVTKNHNNTDYPHTIFEIFREQNFICYIKKNKAFGYFNKNRSRDIFIMLSYNADFQDIFIAFLYAVKIKYMISQHSKVLDLDNQETLFELLETCLLYIKNLDMKMILEKIKDLGWTFDLSSFEKRYCRYNMVFKNI